MSSPRKRAALQKAHAEAEHLRQQLILARHHASVMEAFAMAAAKQHDELRAALEKIADWDGAWGLFPETNEAWGAMVVVTAREAVPREKA